MYIWRVHPINLTLDKSKGALLTGMDLITVYLL